MKITAIKAQVKNDQRVSIFVDGKYSFSLTLDQLLEQKLKKDDKVNEVQIKQLKKLSDEGKLKARATEWLMNRPHSTREFRDYMFRKKAEKELTQVWVDEFTEKGYLSDENFTRWFAENRLRKKKSRRAVTSELASKGISRELADQALNELVTDEVNDEEALKGLVEKLRKRSRYQDEQKLKAYLVSKGFRYDDVKSAIEQAKADLNPS